MSFVTRILLLTTVVINANLALAQTIVKEGNVVPANTQTIALAAEVITSTSNSAEPETYQLTDAVLANLTALELTNVSLFDFGYEDATSRRSIPQGCKTSPGDYRWPTRHTWDIFNLLTENALIETVPIGAVCYTNNIHYNAAKCAAVKKGWTTSELHSQDPTSIMSPLYQGNTCMPENGDTGTCELGGFPSYVVRATKICQIQLAINFARNTNIRLVVKNTGHDFLGRSAGAGALSIWTHELKSIALDKNYKTPSYYGPVLKLGAGVQVKDLYDAADKYGYTAVGGECKGVGVTGGYIAGGGHSPLSSKYGMGADQVLSIDVVLPNGRFITADETNNQDLFWAIRGGGGGTFGVVTSMTVKVYPKMVFSGMTFSIMSGPDTKISVDTFWHAVEIYYRNFLFYADKHSYGYSSIFPRGAPEAGSIWEMKPWLVPDMKLADFKAMVAPLLKEWAAIGFAVTPEFFEYDNFKQAWEARFPTETVGFLNLRTASRLFPRTNFLDPALFSATMAAIKSVAQEGSALIQYNINGAKLPGVPANAVNPAWRDAALHLIIGSMWPQGATKDQIKAVNIKVTQNWMERFRKVTRGGGSYGNEGDLMEPNFQQSFYGSNYARLLNIKEAVDPWGVFWAHTGVGSEHWYVAGQDPWMTLQNGKLCRK